MQGAQEEAGEELRPRTLAGRHEGPSGQQEEWRLVNIERESTGGAGQKERKGRNVKLGDDSSVETLRLVWRGIEEIRTFRQSLGLRVKRIEKRFQSYNERMGSRGRLKE